MMFYSCQKKHDDKYRVLVKQSSVLIAMSLVLIPNKPIKYLFTQATQYSQNSDTMQGFNDIFLLKNCYTRLNLFFKKE